MTSQEKPPAGKRPYIGGQAVIEGVMMRSPRSFAVVVRRHAGSHAGTLRVRERSMPDQRKGVLAWPFIRGVVTLVESLRLGSQALRFSGDLYERDLEEAENSGKPGAGTNAASSTSVFQIITSWLVAAATNDAPPPSESPEPRGRNPMMTIALIGAVALFVALPQLISWGTSNVLHLNLDARSPGFQALTGFFKLTLVLGYMLVIRRIPEIKRVFQFHGAEHKAIATYEAGDPLTVEAARQRPRLHPRCGTTFLVMVVLVSVIVFTGVGSLLPKIPMQSAALEQLLFFGMKLPFLPVIASITYELQRISARYCLTGPLRFTLYPGFAVQLITTIEPDDRQLEVAIASLRATLWREQAAETTSSAPPDRTFASFEELMAEPSYGSVAPAEPAATHAAP